MSDNTTARRRRTVAATEVPEVSPATAGDASKVDQPDVAQADPAKPKRRTAPASATAVTPTGPDKTKKAAPPKELAPLAKEVNVRLEKAAKLESDAQDHRLAAALKLAEAKEICTRAGVSFQKWAEENIKEVNGKEVGFQTIRKLANIGEAEDPKAALEGARAAQAERAKASRDRKKDGEAAPASAPEGDGPFTPKAEAEPPKSSVPKPALAEDEVYVAVDKWAEEARCELVLHVFNKILDGEQKLLLDMVEMMTDNDATDFFNALAAKRGAVVSYPPADAVVDGE